MNYRSLFVAALSTSIAPVIVAQANPTAAARPLSMPDSIQMNTILAGAMRRLKPAQFVLDHRAQLALTPEQVPYLESLVLAETDSERVRMGRQIAEMQKSATTARMTDAMRWTGTIDEEAIRVISRRQAEQSAELQIQMVRDRHAVGAVLTPSQIATLKQLETSDLLGNARSMGFLRPPPSQPGVPYFEFQVDKPALLVPGKSFPAYPESLRASNIAGDVLAQFVVDTTGTPEIASFKALKTSDPLFAQAIKDALPSMHFTPAERGGVKVRQLVQMPFTFEPGKK